mgnify:CR=1 FL=1
MLFRSKAFEKAEEYLNEFFNKWGDKESSEYRAASVEKYSIEIDRTEARILELNALSPDDETRKVKEDAAKSKLYEAITTLKKIHAQISEERQDTIDKILEDADKQGIELEYVELPKEMEERWYAIGFVLARACEMYPRIFVKGTDPHKKAVLFSIESLEEFVYEHDTDSVYIYGGMYLGQLYAALIPYERDPAKRADLKTKVINMFEQYCFWLEPEFFPYLQELAYNELANILVGLGDRQTVYTLVWKKYTEDYPDWKESTEYGQGYLLAAKVARAMYENGEALEAVELLTSVIDRASLRGYTLAAATASKELAYIIQQLGPETMDIKTLLQAGKGFKSKEDWASAISYYQYVIQGLSRKFDEDTYKNMDRKMATAMKARYDAIQKEITEIAIEAFFDIAECFKANGMEMEALVASTEVVTRYSTKLSLVNASRRDAMEKILQRSASLAYGIARSQFYSAAKDGTLTKVTGDLFLRSLENISKLNPAIKGTIAFERGEVKRAFGDYLGSVGEYQTVPDTDPRYADAQYNICVAYSNLSSTAKKAGNEEEATKYRVQAIDSLNAVIDMKRTFGPSEASRQRSWERKKSQCFILLADIYEDQKMNQDLKTLADRWAANFAEKLKVKADRAYYLDDAMKLYVASIKAMVELKDAENAERLYNAVKAIALEGKPTSVPEGKKYDVTIDIGNIMSNICSDIARMFTELGNVEKQNSYQHEATAFQAEKSNPFELFKDLSKYEKNPSLFIATAKQAVLILEMPESGLADFEDLTAMKEIRDTLLSKEYTDTIYFPGDTKKMDQVTAKYKQFVESFVGSKKTRVNYSKANGYLEELAKLDPDKALALWTKPLMQGVDRTLALYNLRLGLYRKIAEHIIPFCEKDAPEEWPLALKALDYLQRYYGAKYKLDAGYVARMAKDFEKARLIYGQLILSVQSDRTDPEAGAKQSLYRYYTSVVYYEWAMNSDNKADKLQYLTRAVEQLEFIMKAFPAVWEKNPEWANELSKFKTERDAAK